jgi:hypothetical protein
MFTSSLHKTTKPHNVLSALLPNQRMTISHSVEHLGISRSFLKKSSLVEWDFKGRVSFLRVGEFFRKYHTSIISGPSPQIGALNSTNSRDVSKHSGTDDILTRSIALRESWWEEPLRSKMRDFRFGLLLRKIGNHSNSDALRVTYRLDM